MADVKQPAWTCFVPIAIHDAFFSITLSGHSRSSSMRAVTSAPSVRACSAGAGDASSASSAARHRPANRSSSRSRYPHRRYRGISRDQHVVLDELAARRVEHRGVVGDALGDDAVAGLGDDDVARRRRDPRSAGRSRTGADSETCVDAGRAPACIHRCRRASARRRTPRGNRAAARSKSADAVAAERRAAPAADQRAARSVASTTSPACRAWRAMNGTSTTAAKVANPPCIGSRQPACASA